jgi:shikimate kinase
VGAVIGGSAMNGKSIVLIGMPSSGKSTIGPLLAERLEMEFVDTDVILAEKAGKRLRAVINEEGLEYFLKFQEETIRNMDVKGRVVATGGSVVYGRTAMQHLQESGTIVYLKLDFDVIRERVVPDRRFARNEGQSLQDLFNERVPLYETYADKIVECRDKSVEQVMMEIVENISFNSPKI